VVIFTVRFLGAICMATIVAGCELKLPSISFGEEEDTSLSPRIVKLGEPVPKGGGHYKVGAPYRINGKRYVPREVSHYDRTGVASWYGKLFHGRHTANGEIYDMEALTAAHPTLPMPSYVRVTNLRNGRSLIVRVNDRGPYARNRMIDLSWAVASLLRVTRKGTAPVRVHYLGRAPLDGNDRRERRYLASQPWAGPQIAYARSPANAMRYLTASVGYDHAVQHSRKTASLRSAPMSPAGETTATAKPRIRPPLPAARSELVKPPRRAVAIAGDPRETRDRHAERRTAAHSASPTQDPSKRRSYYVNAGQFSTRPLADQLAAILGDLAPAAVETMSSGYGPVHQVRLGPFAHGDAARAAVMRLRAAGLTQARIKRSTGG